MGDPSPGGTEVLTVSELCGRLRDLVRALPQPVHVRGEVRDLVRAPSGHAYFTLRDEGAQLACVLFPSDTEAMPGSLRDGLSSSSTRTSTSTRDADSRNSSYAGSDPMGSGTYGSRSSGRGRRSRGRGYSTVRGSGRFRDSPAASVS